MIQTITLFRPHSLNYICANTGRTQ